MTPLPPPGQTLALSSQEYLVAFRPKIDNMSFVKIKIFSDELIDSTSVCDAFNVAPVAERSLKNWWRQFLIEFEKHRNVIVGFFSDVRLKWKKLHYIYLFRYLGVSIIYILVKAMLEAAVKRKSSLHWLVLSFLYNFFEQWNITTKASRNTQHQ